jgi:hypothetical protein
MASAISWFAMVTREYTHDLTSKRPQLVLDCINSEQRLRRKPREPARGAFL